MYVWEHADDVVYTVAKLTRTASHPRSQVTHLHVALGNVAEALPNAVDAHLCVHVADGTKVALLPASNVNVGGAGRMHDPHAK